MSTISVTEASRERRLIKFIELPAIKLVDQDGRNWTALRRREPLVSKQILMPLLEAAGFTCELVNLKDGEEEYETGTVAWRDKVLSKRLVGRQLEDAPDSADLWAVTINYVQEREAACDLIHTLKAGGGKVIVGGSDAFADPQPYLDAGCDAVVQDKSGAANIAICDYICGDNPREDLTGVLLADGRRFPNRRPPMSPQEWPVPSPRIVRETLGVDYWETRLPDELLPIGSVMADIGCDRHCDFCETPLYKLGYRRMSPERVLDWFAAQEAQGARSVICPSDQFLARVLWKTGRDEVLEIMRGIRELGLAVLWGNGLEIQKLTQGKGLPGGDLTPDYELVEAIWGWDGKAGCYQGYIPAERPTFGRENYAKLLPWQEHCEMVRAIVRTGVPDITYGVVVGLPEDSHDSFSGLEEAVHSLYEELLVINPELIFNVTPYAIRPLPGTPQAQDLRASGLLRFEDPAIIGGFWTACADTLHLSYEEVSDWQTRLAAIGSAELLEWQQISGASSGVQVERRQLLS